MKKITAIKPEKVSFTAKHILIPQINQMIKSLRG